MPLYPDSILDSEFEEDLIESRIGVHDSNHFEVKLDYSIRAKGRSRYNIDYYFFVPKSLGVNKYTYRDEQFFADVQAYIRFKTPSLTLQNLSGDDSPLHTISSLVQAIRAAPQRKDSIGDLSNELRMFGCVVRANIRDRVRVLQAHLADLRDGESNPLLLADAAKICSCLVTEIVECLAAWRELRPEFIDGRLPAACNETFAYVDEYLSLVTEMKLTAILYKLDQVDISSDKNLVAARTQALELLLSERQYRIDARYSSTNEGDKDDHFVYRLGLLKKFVMSVLWLDISKEKEGKKAANVGAAIAAGFAMFFALTATILAGQIYGINSWNFIAAGVVTYILKDRIKDWLKLFFGARFSRFLADYSIKIKDPLSGKNIGRCRESVGFRSMEDVPAEVLQCRRRDAKASIESMTKPELVLHYSKEVNLNGQDIIERMNLEDYNINDIVRFSLSEFFVRADDPISRIPYYTEESDSVEKRDFDKVYHINLIMVLTSRGSKRSVLKRVRVIFDKNSIRELQEVGDAPLT